MPKRDKQTLYDERRALVSMFDGMTIGDRISRRIPGSDNLRIIDVRGERFEDWEKVCATILSYKVEGQYG